MTLTAKQRVVLEEMAAGGGESRTPTGVHLWLTIEYRKDGYVLEASVDTIRKQLERLVAKKLVLKRKSGYVISARGRKALA